MSGVQGKAMVRGLGDKMKHWLQFFCNLKLVSCTNYLQSQCRTLHVNCKNQHSAKVLSPKPFEAKKCYGDGHKGHTQLITHDATPGQMYSSICEVSNISIKLSNTSTEFWNWFQSLGSDPNITRNTDGLQVTLVLNCHYVPMSKLRSPPQLQNITILFAAIKLCCLETQVQ